MLRFALDDRLFYVPVARLPSHQWGIVRLAVRPLRFGSSDQVPRRTVFSNMSASINTNLPLTFMITVAIILASLTLFVATDSSGSTQEP